MLMNHPAVADGLRMDKTEISIAAFAEFVAATGMRTKAERDGGMVYEAGWVTKPVVLLFRQNILLHANPVSFFGQMLLCQSIKIPIQVGGYAASSVCAASQPSMACLRGALHR